MITKPSILKWTIQRIVFSKLKSITKSTNLAHNCQGKQKRELKLKLNLFPTICYAKINPKLPNLGTGLLKQRFIFIAIVTAFILALFSYSVPLKAANIMQCMSSCIKQEGDTAAAKAICKLRCANITLPPNSAGNPPYCMSIFKKCTRACDKNNKICWKDCKKGLMGCK